MRPRAIFAGGSSALLLLFSAGLLIRFATGSHWSMRLEPSRMPVMLRPGSVVEFFFTAVHPGLVGIGIEHVPQRRLPRMRLTLHTVPDGVQVADATLRSTRNVLTARFRPLSLPPSATLKARLTVEEKGETVLLRGTTTQMPGGIQERPVIHSYHALAEHPVAAFGAWCTGRVEALLPPGAMTVALVLMLVAPLAGVAVVGLMGTTEGDERSP